MLLCISEHSLTPAEPSSESDPATEHFPDDPHLDPTPPTLNELRGQLCPRISTRDVLHFYENNRDNLLLIDLRDSSSYSQFHVLNSVNIPFEKLGIERLKQLAEQTISSASESDMNILLMYTLQKSPKALKVIYSHQETFSEAIELANNLVRMKFSRVCLIRKGIESFISTKIIYREV